MHLILTYILYVIYLYKPLFRARACVCVGFRRHMLTTNSSKSNASFRHFSDDKVQDVFSKQIKGKYNGDEINTESRMLIYGFTCQQAFNSL